MPASARLSTRPQNCAAGLRVEAGGRLVQEQQLGPADDAERDVEPAPLAAGQAGRRGRRACSARPTSSIDLVRRASGRGSRPRQSRPTRATVSSLDCARSSTRCSTMPMPGLPRRRSPRAGSCPSTRHLAAVAAAVALEDLDGRRLAGPVRPEQREHLAPLAPSRSSPSTAARRRYVLRSPDTRIATSLMHPMVRAARARTTSDRSVRPQPLDTPSSTSTT